MLITINISFCMFSMPMAIIQIVYYSDVYNSNDVTVHATYYSSSSSTINHNINNRTANAFYPIYQYSETNSNETTDLVDLLHAIAELLQYLNHGSNFIFYSLSGKTFRNETKRFFFDKFNLIKSVLRTKLCRISCSLNHNNKFSSSTH